MWPEIKIEIIAIAVCIAIAIPIALIVTLIDCYWADFRDRIRHKI